MGEDQSDTQVKVDEVKELVKRKNSSFQESERIIRKRTEGKVLRVRGDDVLSLTHGEVLKGYVEYFKIIVRPYKLFLCLAKSWRNVTSFRCWHKFE